MRRALDLGTAERPLPSIEAPPSKPAQGSQNGAGSVRKYPGYPLAVECRSTPPDSNKSVFSVSQPRWASGSNPTWHEQFLAMTGPRGYGGPYYGSTNGERLLAVASSVAIGYAVAGLASVIERTIASPLHHKLVNYKADRKQRKIEKVRADIRAELAQLERVNASARASGQAGVR